MRSENALLWTVVEGSGLGAAVIDSDDTILLASPGFSRIVDRTVATLLGRSVVHCAGAFPVDGMALLRKGERVPSTFSKDGGDFHLEWQGRAATLGDGSPVTVITVTDRTEQTKLRYTLSQLQGVVEQMSAAVAISDARAPDMPLVYVNRRFLEVTGYAMSDVIGRNCRFLQGTQTDQPAVATLRNAIQASQTCSVILQNFKKDGTPFVNHLHISPVFDDLGLLTYFVGIQLASAAQ